MFLEAEGPTALRAGMVHSLAFSVGERDIDVGGNMESCISALASVWNGNQGFVAVLVRSLERPMVRRFAFSEPIASGNDLDEVVETGMGFAASMGFFMDDPEFKGLESEERDSRIERWNRLRKPDRSPLADPVSDPVSATPDPPTGAISSGEPVQPRSFEDTTVVAEPQMSSASEQTVAVQPAQEQEPPPDPGDAEENSGVDTKTNVLGRVELIRQDESGRRRVLLGRLLRFF